MQANTFTHIKYTDEIAETLVRFGNDKEDFDNDKVFRNAVSMPMLQIGELAKELKDDCTDTIDIPLIASVIKRFLLIII